MNLYKPYTLALLLLALLGFSSCTEEGPGETDEVNFDQQAMLTNIGQNIIFPAYANFSTTTSLLEEAIHEFTEQPTAASLAAAQDALKATYHSWIRVEPFEFGPAMEVNLRMNINHFPTDFSEVEESIAAGSWDLNGLYSSNKKGLPALDYLLFSGASQEEILAAYTTAENAEARRQYLHEVTDQVTTLANEVYTAWSDNGENYLGDFISNTGTEAGTSLSNLVNQFNQGYEITKNKRLGIPIGVNSMKGDVFPRATEAFYSGISLPLMQAHLLNMEALFKGEANGTDGLGLDDYIDAIYEAGNIQDDLSATILSQFQNIHSAVAAIPEPLPEAIVNNPDKTRAAYDEIVALMQYIKTDMPSALSVNISYVDNDGD
ncbi:imelysin family protein [Nafulsella turpanensis]|uniref:imelysin family protein n=1 Tax=Nafulsella turpanensis TaxID=1265690 RepID=UPI0003452C74|nr:imelysin family protein [Nafulsella turpanensis]